MPIALQIPCNTLHFFPKTAENLKKICAVAGLNVTVPENETCCGLPFFEKGEAKSAKTIGEYNLNVYGTQQMICPEPKCKNAFKIHYPRIFNNTVSHNETMNMVKNISDLNDIIKRLPQDLLMQISGNFFLVKECTSQNNNFILPQNESLTWHTSFMNKTCCGAGTSLPCNDPQTASQMAQALIDEFKESGAQAMVFEDDICRKHVQNISEKSGNSINTYNIIDIIASVL